jgi:DNA invertase Pin-like site-specific DNA recombinase/exonuclease VII small subunit
VLEKPRPLAYSYVRFSSKRQEHGDSLRRQIEMAETYAKEHNLRLSAQSFRDLGVSGFKQRNLKQGALAAFISAVRSGTIEPGSYLLIEQFDRLSRAEVTVAFRLLLDLIEAGVTVVTLVDRKVWNEESIQDVVNVLVSIILMSRAHEESSAKAKRLREKWGQKKLAAAQEAEQPNRKIVTSECPRWLTPNQEKTGFIVDQEKAESVRKVFAARIGGHGIVSIVTKANNEKWTVPGKPPIRREGETDDEYEARKAVGATWHTSLVGRLLKNRATLGEYQPYKYTHVKLKGGGEKKVRITDGNVIQDYYPAILNKDTFMEAEGKAVRSGRFPGRRDASLKNWLQGLLRCTCGHNFVRKNKDSKAQPNYARYYCAARNRGVRRADGSLCPGANAAELENAVIYVISNVAPGSFDGTDTTAELKTRIEVLQVELSAAVAVRERYADSIGDSDAPLESLVRRLKDAEKSVEEKEAELRKARAKLADLGGNNEEAVARILKAVRGVSSIDERAALREQLSRLIDKVVVHEPEGYVEVFMRDQPEVGIVQRLRPDGDFPGLTFTPMTEEEHREHVEKWVPPSRAKDQGKKSQ